MCNCTLGWSAFIYEYEPHCLHSNYSRYIKPHPKINTNKIEIDSGGFIKLWFQKIACKTCLNDKLFVAIITLWHLNRFQFRLLVFEWSYLRFEGGQIPPHPNVQFMDNISRFSRFWWIFFFLSNFVSRSLSLSLSKSWCAFANFDRLWMLFYNIIHQLQLTFYSNKRTTSVTDNVVHKWEVVRSYRWFTHTFICGWIFYVTFQNVVEM